VAQLQNNHQQLNDQLSQARTVEIAARRTAIDLTEELDTLRAKHRREITELELDKSRQDREIRELKEEVKSNEEDIKRERATVSSLKASLAPR
jgi:kinesin family member C1